MNKLDQIDKWLPRHYLIHFGKELLLFGALFGGALLIIGEAKLFATQNIRLGLDLCPYSRSDGLCFPASP